MSQTPVIGFGCAICSDVFSVNGQRNICTISQCGHVYHEYCIKRWFRTQIRQGTRSNCPKCRTPATGNQIIRLYLHQTLSDNNGTAEAMDEGENYEDENDDFDSSSSEYEEQEAFSALLRRHWEEISWTSILLPTQTLTHSQTIAGPSRHHTNSEQEHEQEQTSPNQDENDDER